MRSLLHVPRRITTAALAAALVTTAALPASATSEPTVTTVADGFAGPLGLDVDRHGTAWIGESFAGLLTTVDRHGNRAVRVETGGMEVAGVSRGLLSTAFTTTEYEAPTEPGGEPGAVVESTLDVLLPGGRTRTIASLYDHEVARNPDADARYGIKGVDGACLALWPAEQLGPARHRGLVDSHPYAVANTLGGWVVADAAANAILKVGLTGRVRTLAVLPRVRNVISAEVAGEFGLDDCFVGATYFGEPVPTDIEVGPDGNYYVSSLPGAPELPGTGAVWRVNPVTGAVKQIATGLSSAVDLAVARDGTIYVAELFANQISTVSRKGTVRPYVSVPMPGTVEIDHRGRLWATTDVFGNGTLVSIED